MQTTNAGRQAKRVAVYCWLRLSNWGGTLLYLACIVCVQVVPWLRPTDRLFKRHGRWRSETAKDGYVKDSVEKCLGVSKHLRL